MSLVPASADTIITGTSLARRSWRVTSNPSTPGNRRSTSTTSAPLSLKFLQPVLSALSFRYGIPLLAQEHAERGADVGVVFDQQDVCSH